MGFHAGCKPVVLGLRGSIPHALTNYKTGTGSDSGPLPSEGREEWCKSTVLEKIRTGRSVAW